jgi:predicted nucleic acid-binding Zn ribbon protein
MQPAGRLLGTLKIAKDLQDPEARLRAVWPKAAGAKIAPHTRVASLVRKTLVVEVEDMVWQRQLAPLAHFIVRNLARETGEVLVEEIDFRPARPRMGPQRAESHTPAVRKNPAAAGSAGSEEAGIGDPFLRLQYRKSKQKESA